MTEIDYLKLKLEDKEKAFDKLHKLHMESLKKQGELEKENEKLKQRIKEETDRVIKLEQYVYTKLCPKSEHYDEKVLSEVINAILGDIE